MEPHIQPHWEHYEHERGIGVRGFGETVAEAFEQAALATTAAVTSLSAVAPWEAVTIRCQAPNHDLLLDEWLNALIHEMAEKKMLFSRFAVRIDGERLTAEALGEGIDPSRHRPVVELQRARVHEPEVNATLPVAKHGDGWVAQTVVRV